ncbi:E3 ubiquitin-protein ligase RNF180-like isoform X2 [Prorops nasuta]|uniref:E3 ubiquitin-protein ligase RNF180-like isoform X2 n=1 Tax=Prorops nasuta TaxID=863751 RepID=UPI0034CDE613
MPIVMITLRCKHCRKILFTCKEDKLLSAHNEIRDSTKQLTCASEEIDSCLYMSDDNIPEWIKEAINQNSWTKGRLNCLNCNIRIGSFNFVNVIKCNCKQYVIPPIRLIYSKVDLAIGNQ